MTVASPIPPSNPLDHERAPGSEPDDELARIWRAIGAVNDSIAELRRVGGMPQPEPIVTRAEACSCDEAIGLRTEVRRLKGELRTQQADREALVEQVRLAQQQRDGYRQGLERLRQDFDRDAETCRSALDRADELQRELDEARAEVERLRAEREATLAPEGQGGYLDLVRRAQAAEARLAAANALLVRVEQHPDVRGQLKDAVRGHLAGQGAPFMRAAETQEQAQQDALHALNRRYHRHEAEQRVLDACAEVQISTDAVGCEDGRPRFIGGTLLIAAAELARRGLKP